MAEPESIQTMLQAAFVKVADGDYNLKTTGGGGGSTTVKLDPTQNTVKIDPANNDVTALDPQREGKFETLTAVGDVAVDTGTTRIVVCTLSNVPAGYYSMEASVAASKKPNDASLSPICADITAGAKVFRLIFGTTGAATEDPDLNPEMFINLTAPTTVTIGVTNNPAPSAGSKVAALLTMTRLV